MERRCSIVWGAMISMTAWQSLRAESQPVLRVHDDVTREVKIGPLGGMEDGGIAGASAEVCNLISPAYHGQPVPETGGGTLVPIAFAQPASINASGKIAFYAQVEGSPRNQGIFMDDGSGNVSPVAIGCGGGGGSGDPGDGCGDPSPLGGTFSGFFFGTFGAPCMNDAGDVLFIADVDAGSAPRGLFLYRAATDDIVKIAAVGDSSPLGGTFAAVGPGSMNNAGTVVFLAQNVGSADANIFRWSNGIVTKHVAVGDPAPVGATGSISMLGTETLGFLDGTSMPVGPLPDINDNGQVSFRALFSSGGRAEIVTTNGVHQIYVMAGDVTPAGGTYFDFQGAILNNAGQIAFFADYQISPDFNSGWFVGAPGNWREAISFFDPVDDQGSVCFGLAFSRNPMQPLDDEGNLQMWITAQLSDQTEQERQVISHPDGSITTAARRTDPAPLGGIIGSMDAWPSKSLCRGSFGCGTPGGPGIFSAQMVFTLCVAGDVTGDCRIDINDLFAVIGAWGPCPAPPEECPEDLDGNLQVGIDDLFEVITNWTTK